MNGSSDKAVYKAGETVTITANAQPGKEFAGWTGDVAFADAKAAATTFVMPAKAATVTATYSAIEDTKNPCKLWETFLNWIMRIFGRCWNWFA